MIINEIVSYFSTVALLILTLFLYVFLISCVYPGVLRLPNQTTALPKDRGLKKHVFPGGRAIVYQPCANVRQYIPQYILSFNNNNKYIQCKVSECVSSIEYDVTAFDARRRKIACIKVSEIGINSSKITSAAVLPDKTSYVNLVVRRVNDHALPIPPLDRSALIRVAVFSGLVVISTLLEMFLAKAYLIHLADNFFSYTDVVGSRGALFTWFIALLFGCLYAVLTLHSYYPGKIKITRGDKTTKWPIRIDYILY